MYKCRTYGHTPVVWKLRHNSVLYLGWRGSGRSSSVPWANCEWKNKTGNIRFFPKQLNEISSGRHPFCPVYDTWHFSPYLHEPDSWKARQSSVLYRLWLRFIFPDCLCAIWFWCPAVLKAPEWFKLLITTPPCCWLTLPSQIECIISDALGGVRLHHI